MFAASPTAKRPPCHSVPSGPMQSLKSDSGPSRRMPAASLIADYERPSLTEALARARALAHQLGAATDADEAIAIVQSWNQLRSSVYAQRTRAQVRHYQ